MAEVMAEPDAHGVRRIEPSEAMRADRDAFLQADLPVIVSGDESPYGLADAPAELDAFQALIHNWAAIVEETGDGRDAMIARLHAEVHHELPADHGL